MEKICEKYGRLPPRGTRHHRRTPQRRAPTEAVADAASAAAGRAWTRPLPSGRAQTSRSARQQENEDQELLRQFGVSPQPFTPRHHIPDEAPPTSMPTSRRRAPTTSTWAWGLAHRTARRRRPRRLARLCTQQTNCTTGSAPASWQKRRPCTTRASCGATSTPSTLSARTVIFNAPFRLPARRRRCCRGTTPRSLPGSRRAERRGLDRRSPRRRRTRGRRPPRRARPAQHAPAVARTRSRNRHARRLHGRRPPAASTRPRTRTLVWARRAGRLRLRLQRM